MENAIVASFFSYKGGAGRTTSTLNTCYYLVTEVLRPTIDNPLLIIDADTESAGISYLLTKDITSSLLNNQSLQGLCQAAKNNKGLFNPDDGAVAPELFSAYRELRSKFVPVGDQFGVDKAAVLLLRSNVRGFNTSVEEYVDPMNDLVSLAKSTCNCSIIFDTPSGTQALSRAALRLSDTIVCHMRPTNQFQQGTMDFLQRYFQQPDTSFVNVILCPSVVPIESVVIDNEQYPNTYCEQLDKFVAEMKRIANDCMSVTIVDLMTKSTPAQFYKPEYTKDLAEYHQRNIVGIPEINRFKWREGLLSKVPSLTTEEKLACERYCYLANIIAGKAE